MSGRDAEPLSEPEEKGAFFNAKAETARAEGAFLPHWTQGGALTFVTFRLADSLPQEKVKRIARERDEWLRAHPEPRNEEQEHQFHRLFSRRLQRLLDAGHGSMILAKPPLRKIVEDALKYFDGIRYHLDEFVVAANHVHVLMAPKAGFTLPGILHSWKSFTANEIGRAVRAEGFKLDFTVWQQESWDHLVRSEASFEKFRRYIRKHRE